MRFFSLAWSTYPPLCHLHIIFQPRHIQDVMISWLTGRRVCSLIGSMSYICSLRTTFSYALRLRWLDQEWRLRGLGGVVAPIKTSLAESETRKTFPRLGTLEDLRKPLQPPMPPPLQATPFSSANVSCHSRQEKQLRIGRTLSSTKVDSQDSDRVPLCEIYIWLAAPSRLIGYERSRK